MTQSLQLAMAQIDCRIGHFAYNAQKIVDCAQQAHALGVDVLLFPELTLTGYYPEDLVSRPHFLQEQDKALQILIQSLATFKGLHAVVGHLAFHNGQLFNAVSVLHEGEVIATYHKQALPNYSVFDEKRYFTAGQSMTCFEVKGHRFGLAICEDVWLSCIAEQVAQAHVDTLLVANASPYTLHKHQERLDVLKENLGQSDVWVAYCNMVAGQDEVVFDGHSFLLNPQSEPVAQLDHCVQGLALYAFKEESWQHLANYPLNTQQASDTLAFDPQEPLESQIWRVLVLGVQDFLAKNNMKKALLGLSGGIDSAVVLAILADALDPKDITAISMPSRFTADLSVDAATQMATRLGVNYHVIPIEPIQQQFLQTLAPVFEGTQVDTTEENLQARIRGVILMAMSNKFGGMVIPCGNKSEMAVGYATLYGDMVGGYALIKDVPKTWIFRLAKWRNRDHEVIPVDIINRPPSAELAENQVDQDSLPPYDLLDVIIEQLVEQGRSSQELIDQGFDEEAVKKTARLLKIAEYKRKQAAPGPRITRKSFGKDWRYPIAQDYAY